jgi:hypothetical protein
MEHKPYEDINEVEKYSGLTNRYIDTNIKSSVEACPMMSFNSGCYFTHTGTVVLRSNIIMLMCNRNKYITRIIVSIF